MIQKWITKWRKQILFEINEGVLNREWIVNLIRLVPVQFSLVLIDDFNFVFEWFTLEYLILNFFNINRFKYIIALHFVFKEV